MYDVFFKFFSNTTAHHYLQEAIQLALSEDGTDLTTNAVFSHDDSLSALIIAKQETLLAGIPLIPMILAATAEIEPGMWDWESSAPEGALVADRTTVAKITGSARIILRAERVILNFLTHLAGIANLTRSYVTALQGTGVHLLDTRKTLPGLRYPEKYAVLVGGGYNHRKNLSDLLMLKDNHIDAGGGITATITRLQSTYDPCPPIEVECRTRSDVREAVACSVHRIMLDNMKPHEIAEALPLIPQSIEVEISGGITLQTIKVFATASTERKPDYISVGRLTHSAIAADLSMRITRA